MKKLLNTCIGAYVIAMIVIMLTGVVLTLALITNTTIALAGFDAMFLGAIICSIYIIGIKFEPFIEK